MPDSYSSIYSGKPKNPSELNNGFNLTKAILYGRTTLKIFVGGIIFLMIGRFLWNAGVDLYMAMNPPEPPPPTVGFGVLPPLILTPQDIARPKTYVLETANGSFSQFPDRASVYYMPQAQQGLLSADQAAVLARSLGFPAQPEQLDQQTLRFKQVGVVNETLELNSITHNLEYTTDYLARPELQSSKALATSFDAVTAAKGFFNRADLLPSDINGEGETTFIKVIGGTLQEAVSLSDAQLLYVELSRNPLGDAKIRPIRSDGSASTLRALVGILNGGPRVIRAERDYFPIDYSVTETYPIRTANQAWNALKAGEGIIAGGTHTDAATVRNVELRYLESESYQKYYQPVFVFTGDSNFIGIVPAILPEWTASEAE